MKINQVQDLVNSALKEVNGTSALLKDDLSNTVDVGKEIIDSDNVDNYVHKLIDRVGQTVFNNRVYQGNAPSLLMTSWQYGSILEKIDTDLPKAEQNDSWSLQDGQEYKQDIFYQPKVTAKFFNSKTTFDIPLSFTSQQVQSSFNSATELNGFISMLMQSVQNAMTVNIDNLIMRTLNNMTGTVLNANKPLSSINLLANYNTATGQSLTANKALTDKEFLRYATAKINTLQNRLTKISTLFNLGAKQRFTPLANQHLILLSDFSDNANTYLKADTFNSNDVGLNNSYDVVPYWQGTGTDYSFNNTSAIDVAIKDGTTTKEIKQSGIIGVLADSSLSLTLCTLMIATKTTLYFM